MIILGSAGVNTTVKVSRFPDLQRTDALDADLPELGVISDNHLVLHPFNLGLLANKIAQCHITKPANNWRVFSRLEPNGKTQHALIEEDTQYTLGMGLLMTTIW